MRTPSGSFLIQLGSYLLFIQAECSRTSLPTSSKTSTPVSFRSWNMELMNPWLAGMFPRVLSTELSDLWSTARDFIEAFAFYPDKIHPATELALIGVYASQHPTARLNYISRIQDESAVKAATGKVPVPVILGKDDKFLLSDRVEKLYKETFAGVEVQVWPEVGHIPFLLRGTGEGM